MQNVGQSDTQKLDKVNVQLGLGKSSTPHSSTTAKSEKEKSEKYLELQPLYVPETDSSESDEDSVSEVESFVIDQGEIDEDADDPDDPEVAGAKFLLEANDNERSVDPETQARLEALLEAAGIGKLTTGDGKHLGDPEVLRRLTSSVSCALDEAAAALTRMRNDNPRNMDKSAVHRTLVEACSDGDVRTVRKLLTEGRSVHETTEDGESLLSLACSAGYYELAQVLLAMNANVEDRGIKGDCTPLMEAASAGHSDIVRLLIANHADVNAQSTSGNTPLMYGCAGGHDDVVRVLLLHGANVEDHNENGHTPLMEAASAGHVGVARILLEHGAGINTHSNEFKESALTLACYKGHLDMVRFLLQAGADQEHKTDEMHTALMEASMDGHVEVARLLLDSGAQVNMPTDSFESPLTLAACGGHVDLAMLLIERGANIEEVNDEGYTPLMEAAREGHEEMVGLLLSQGANINAQTEETQETALTLACCGGFLEVADYLIKAGADIELGASTPLMEAAQEGHLDLVKYLLEANADVHAQTQTGDTALTYACENGHTDVAELLLHYGADLEHESEGGRTPLMKACRAGHICTVKFLISKQADVNRQTTNNDHTPLSLACAGGHQPVVETLLKLSADPFHKLKDSSTMLIEAAKGGHTNVVQLLLDYPHSIMLNAPLQSHLIPTPAGGFPIVSDAVCALPKDETSMSIKEQQPSLSRPPINQSSLVQTQPNLGQLNIVQSSLSQPHTIITQAGLATTMDLGRFNQTHPVNLIPAQGINQTVQNQSGSILAHIKRAKSQANFTQALAQGLNQGLQQGLSVPFSTNLSGSGSMEPTSPQNSIIQNPAISNPIQGAMPQVPIQPLMGLNHSPGPILNQLCTLGPGLQLPLQPKQRSMMRKNKLTAGVFEGLTVADPPQGLIQPLGESVGKDESSILDKGSTCDFSGNDKTRKHPTREPTREEQIFQKQQILEELQRVERELHIKNPIHFIGDGGCPPATLLPSMPYIDITTPASNQPPGKSLNLASDTFLNSAPASLLPATYQTPPVPSSPPQAPIHISASSEVSQNTAISDRPKAKPVSKKEGKNQRKAAAMQAALQAQQVMHLQQMNQQLNQVIQQTHLDPMLTSDGISPPNSNQMQSQMNVLSGVPIVSQQQQQQHPPSQMPVIQQSVAQLHQVIQQVQPNTASSSISSKMSITTPSNIDSHRVSMTPEQLMCHLTQLEPSLAALPPQELYQHVHQVLRDKSQQILQKKKLSESDLVSLLMDSHEQTRSSRVFEDNSMEEVVRSLESIIIEEVTDGSSQSNLNLPLDQNVLEEVALTAKFIATNSMSGSSKIPFPSHGVPVDSDEERSRQEEKARQYQAGFHTAMLMAKKHWPEAYQTVQQKMMQTNNVMDGNPIHHSNPPEAAQLKSNETMSYPHGLMGDNLLLPQPHLQAPLPVTAQAIALSNTIQTSITPVPFTPQAQCVQHNQVQVATQTQHIGQDIKPLPKPKISNTIALDEASKGKKGRFLHPRLPQEQQPNFQMDPNTINQQYGQNTYPQGPYTSVLQGPFSSCMDVDSETDSNHDTALTLACAGGHDDLVELLLSRGADIEHRDKKGFTPLILAATAGHERVVEIVLNHGADIEAQSERTKDTPLSLACSGGRYEVVELLLSRGSNKEHRNVSDYTPLSLAASGGYVNIIKLLLGHGAEINSRTGSKLGISPLMLAAMNGHTAAVKLLLDMGSDINAQIETNRNTALTLACFQGRHEVVSLLLDRKANVEHRAKTGLTPLMEAASGGYVEVGRVLLDKGADVNATPVPSSRDTALTIAADKGHCRFVELLLLRNAAVEVKNKKGNSPLWLAANGGHLNVVELLYNANADIDSQDNRKVSCLMAAFRKGHTKVIKWMVNHVTQFPSDQEMTRFICTLSDKELLEKCHECVQIIRAAKDTQAAKANKNASILLEELDMEKNREECKKAAAARRRERKKKKKLEKKEEKRKLHEENQRNEDKDDDKDDQSEKDEAASDVAPLNEHADKEEGDSGIDANSQGSCSSADVKHIDKSKTKKKKKTSSDVASEVNTSIKQKPPENIDVKLESVTSLYDKTCINTKKVSVGNPNIIKKDIENITISEFKNIQKCLYRADKNMESSNCTQEPVSRTQTGRKGLVFEASRHPAEREDFEATGNENYLISSSTKSNKHFHDSEIIVPVPTIPKGQNSKQPGRRDEGWKEVTRKSSVQVIPADPGSKKVIVPVNAIARVIGRGGSNINAIRAATGAFIEIEKQTKAQSDRSITIRGSGDAFRHAYTLIQTLIKDPDVDVMKLLPQQNVKVVTPPGSWDKILPAQIPKPNKSTSKVIPVTATKVPPAHAPQAVIARPGVPKVINFAPTINRGALAPRLLAAVEKRASVGLVNTKTTMSYTSAIMTAGKPMSKVSASNNSFAAKLTEVSVPVSSINLSVKKSVLAPPQIQSAPVSPPGLQASPKHPRGGCSISYSSGNYPNPPGKATVIQAPPHMSSTAEHLGRITPITHLAQYTGGQLVQDTRSPTPTSLNMAPRMMQQSPSNVPVTSTVTATAPNKSSSTSPMEYSLFKETSQQSMWGSETSNKVNFAAVTGGNNNLNIQPSKYVENEQILQVDASKAPGYRGTVVSSPVSSKASCSSTPPSLPPALPGSVHAPCPAYQQFNTSDMPAQIKSSTGLPPASGLAVARPLSNAGAGVSGSNSSPAGNSQSSSSHTAQISSAIGNVVRTSVSSVGQSPNTSVVGQNNNSHIDQLNIAGGRQQVFQDRPLSNSVNHPHHPNMVSASQAHGFGDNNHLLYHISNSQSQSNTTVTMSRLNPRASVFSSSVHGMSKQAPQSMQQQGPLIYNSVGYTHAGHSTAIPPPAVSNPVIMANFHKSPMPQSYHQQPPRPTNLNTNGGSSQNRWPFLAPYPSDLSNLSGSQSQASGITHMSSMANISQPQDILGLENGGLGMNSPSMSPSSPSSHNGNPIEDRKIPRPIGTERAWQKYSSGGSGDADSGPGTWLVGASGMGHSDQVKHGHWAMPPNQYVRKQQYDEFNAMERYQQQQQLLAQMQLDRPNQFLNLMSHSTAPMVGGIPPYMTPPNELGQQDNCPEWDDKHGWTSKWNH